MLFSYVYKQNIYYTPEVGWTLRSVHVSMICIYHEMRMDGLGQLNKLYIRIIYSPASLYHCLLYCYVEQKQRCHVQREQTEHTLDHRTKWR